MLGTFHIIFAIAALILGAVVFCRLKGDRKHRVIGYFYVFSLLSVNVSALSVYEDSASGGPFHILAVVSLVTLICGFIPAFTHRPKSWWLSLHAYFMSWSYVGLVAAGAGQLATMLFSKPVMFTVGLPTVLIVIVGGVLIHSRIPKILTENSSGKGEPNKLSMQDV